MNKYLFLDRSCLQPQGMDNARLMLAAAEKDTANNPLFHEDFFSTPSLPWEARYDNAYPNVIYDPKYQSTAATTPSAPRTRNPPPPPGRSGPSGTTAPCPPASPPWGTRKATTASTG